MKKNRQQLHKTKSLLNTSEAKKGISKKKQLTVDKNIINTFPFKEAGQKLICEKHYRILIGKDRCVDCDKEVQKGFAYLNEQPESGTNYATTIKCPVHQCLNCGEMGQWEQHKEELGQV